MPVDDRRTNEEMISGRARSTRFVIPAAPADHEAARSFMRECLVPILAHEFRRRHLRQAMGESFSEVNAEHASIRPLDMEVGS
jgi:hypothetical protein